VNGHVHGHEKAGIIPRMHLDHIHLWQIDLHLSPDEEQTQFALLSEDEQKRALRFLADKHKKRFIAARSGLRRILSQYLSMPPEAITFSYSEHHKPALAPTHQSDLQFNLAHSSDKAVIAITHQHAIGVDIEKMKPKDCLPLAKRFFSPQEYADLLALPKTQQPTAFYCIWSRKEAILKAIGTGLSLPLSSFSVACDERLEKISLENAAWSLVSIPVLNDYQTAVATNSPITSVSLWHFFDHKPTLAKVFKW
jgi:4'-phosphopantetheinyl transferase